MTNNWTDLGNSTLFIVMGANPVENHPASIAHINQARALPGKTLPGGQVSQKPAAELIVIDPRKTRTALQADKYIRIRPGTDIAFINGMVNHIIAGMEGGDYSAEQKANWEAFLNRSSDTLTFQADGTTGTDTLTRSKYTDARFVVKSDKTDYNRVNVLGNGGKSITGVPEFASAYNAVGVDTVFNKLKEHVAPYTAEVAADICGCNPLDIAYVADKIVENSRCSSFNPAAPTTTVGDPTSEFYRSTTFMYAMGLTQHTCGSQNVKSFATIQLLMGNTGRAGGGINALRGIHNVQGSTDMGLLYHLIPGYSANPSVQPWEDAQAFGKYMDRLYGLRLSNGTGPYDDAYDRTKGSLQQPGFYNMTMKWFADTSILGDRTKVDLAYSLWPKLNGTNHIRMFRNMVDAGVATGESVTFTTDTVSLAHRGIKAGSVTVTGYAEAVDYKINYVDGKITRLAGGSIPASGTVSVDYEYGITAAFVWGQNPAVTEPNQTMVRQGLENLDLLVVADVFATETAMCARKNGGVTYLIPTASHVEEPGSATNSGRVLQWRYQALPPKGNSITDLELAFKLAEAIDGAGGFSHISDVWDLPAMGLAYTSVYDKLWATQYSYTAAGFNTPSANFAFPVTPAEVTVEEVYKEMCSNVATGGTMWLYTNAWKAAGANEYPTGYPDVWTMDNRAKMRNNGDKWGTLAFPRWGFAWLVNRRVLYNNGDIHQAGTTTASDQGDGYQGPDQCGRLFVSTNAGLIDYSRNYRTIHRLADMPKLPGGAVPTIHKTPGRFPSFVEPYETPREDLAGIWGQNTAGGAPGELAYAGTERGTVDDFPLVLTTIRCVEHFQGGPITRNNWWNVELEPEPWIEINLADATDAGILDGDMVRVITARTLDASGNPAYPAAYGSGFRARVGAGLQPDQKVGQGVVAIPWHWGERGLSTGSRANDLTIDAMDANTTIPEYKVCLCRIEKM